MAWSWAGKGKGHGGHKGDAWSIEGVEGQPTSKRRRISDKHQPAAGKSDEAGDNEEWGNDSLELTQADLESLDVMASQVITHAPPSHESKEESFVKPNIPGRLSTNKSSSSSDSSNRPNSCSSAPRSSDASLSSHSSCNGQGQSGRGIGRLDSLESLQSQLEKKEQLIRQAQDEKYRHDGEVKYLRESIHKQEQELEKLRAARDDEAIRQKQMQSDKEKNLLVQVERLTSQAQFKEREYQELQQMFHTLQHKIKDKEQQEKSSPSVGMQGNPSSDSEKSKTNSPRKVVVKPSPPSKLKQQQEKEDQLSSSQRHNFPTCSSFLETTVGPSTSKAPSPSNSKTSVTVTHPATPNGLTANSSQQKRARRLKLRAVCPENQGNGILRAVINPRQESGKSPDPGLPSLLHAMSTSLTLDSLSYSRLKDASLLTPFKPKRRSHAQESSNTASAESTVQVVSVENFNLAIQGLEILLSQSAEAKEDPRTKFFQSKGSCNFFPEYNASPEKDGTSKRQTASDIPPSTKSSSAPVLSSSSSVLSSNIESIADSKCNILDLQCHQTGAVLLLPMLCDYLHHYVDMINCPHSKRVVKSANTTPVASTNQGFSSVDSLPLHTSSCSYDSSLDSLSSSVLQLLHDGRVYAGAIERHALSALRCLNILTQLCPIVTSVIVKSSPQPPAVTASTKTAAHESKAGGGTSVNTGKLSTNVQKLESESDADDEKSTSSSELRIIRGSNATQSSLSSAHLRHSTNNNLMNQSTIMYLVVSLAGEDVEDGNSSSEAVEEALRLLTQLCYNCSLHQVPVLETVVDRGVLSSALSQTKHPAILLEGQKLCKALACHNELMQKICNKSENCPLYMMYRLCSSRRLDISSPSTVKIYVEHISFLSTMSLQHRNGLCPFVLNCCPCSDELVISVILATHKIFALYAGDPQGNADDKSLLHSLLQAIYVLHSLAQGDSAFLQHHAPVQPTYVVLLSRMAAAFKPLRTEWDWHVSALEELCDVEPELSESSQDSDGEERMETS